MEFGDIIDSIIETSLSLSFDRLKSSLFAAAGHSHGLVIDNFCRGALEAVRPTLQDIIFHHIEDRAKFYEAEEIWEEGDEGDGEEAEDLDDDLFGLH